MLDHHLFRLLFVKECAWLVRGATLKQRRCRPSENAHASPSKNAVTLNVVVRSPAAACNAHARTHARTHARKHPGRGRVKTVWVELRCRKLGAAFRMQVVDESIVDFLSPPARVVVEVDGGLPEVKGCARTSAPGDVELQSWGASRAVGAQRRGSTLARLDFPALSVAGIRESLRTRPSCLSCCRASASWRAALLSQPFALLMLRFTPSPSR